MTRKTLLNLFAFFLFVSCSQIDVMIDSSDISRTSSGANYSAPTLSVPGGGATVSHTISVTPSTEDSTIHYTIDGSTPTTGSPVYGGSPIVITTDTVLKVIEEYPDGSTSEIVTEEYTIGSYRLTLDFNGGSDPDNNLANHNYDNGEVVALPLETPVPPSAYGNSGALKEWNTAANGSGTAYQPGANYTMGASDAALYAIWHNKFAFTTSGGNATITGWNPAYTPTAGEDGHTIIDSSVYDGSSSYTVTEIDDSAFENDTVFSTISLPATLDRIGGGAFTNTVLTEVTVPDSVTYIGYFPNDATGAFEANTLLTSVTIGNGIASVEDSFYNSDNIATIVLRPGISAIGDNAFAGISALASITIPDSVTSIGDNVFSGTSLVNITLGSGVTVIGGSLFQGVTTLQSVTFNGLVTSIGDSAFQGTTSLQSITLPDTVSTLGRYAFQNSGLTSIRLPDSLTKLPSRVFSGASDLASIDLNNLVEIGDQSDNANGHYVFENTNSLTSITLPASVTFVDEYAFRGGNLTTVTMQGSVPPTLRPGMDVGDNAGPLHKGPALRNVTTINVPAADLAAYAGGSGWGGYSDILVGY